MSLRVVLRVCDGAANAWLVIDGAQYMLEGCCQGSEGRDRAVESAEAAAARAGDVLEIFVFFLYNLCTPLFLVVQMRSLALEHQAFSKVRQSLPRKRLFRAP